MKTNNRNYFNATIYTAGRGRAVCVDKNADPLSDKYSNFSNREDCEKMALETIKEWKSRGYKTPISSMRISHVVNGKNIIDDGTQIFY